MSDVSLVESPSRLHLGLHDCGYATQRLFGGVGVSINGFPTIVESRPATTTSLDFETEQTPSDRAIQEASEMVERTAQKVGDISVKVLNIAPEHFGFGSKTSLLMAIGQSAFLAYDYQPDTVRVELAELTGRGGTSGIGVNSFWTGGLVVDGGHATNNNVRTFAPSSARHAQTPAPVLAQTSMPEDWRVQLFYDPQANTVEGEKEKALFRQLMPLPDDEIYKTMAATFHGLVPAAIEADIQAFAEALRTINTSGMKKHELQHQSDSTQECMTKLWAEDIAGGLTSFGPTVFSIGVNGSSEMDRAAEIVNELGLENLGTHSFNNLGATYA